MADSNTYEEIHSTNLINVIDRENFPRAFPPHWHRYGEIVILPQEAAGEKMPSLRVNQALCRMEPGDVLFIWPGELHETVENGEGVLAGVQFSMEILDELPEFVQLLPIFRTFRQVHGSGAPLLTRALREQILRMLEILRQGENFGGVESRICLYRLFIELGIYVRETADPARRVPEGGRMIEKISSVCSYITENCEQELTLESAAAHTGFSPCYFSRIFKRVMNYSFTEYLTLQRIKRAQLLLAESESSITEIAYLAGFQSLSTFNRVFRRCRGCSPSQYRRYYLR